MSEQLLKKFREQASFTQEVIADQMDVSVNTIQNWERGSNIASDQLHKLLDFYKVSDKERKECVLALYGNKVSKETNETECVFPEFLFKEDTAQTIKNLVFEKEEQDLFGLLYHYGSGNKELSLKNIPYQGITEFGGIFQAVNLRERIMEKLANFNIKQIFTWCVNHPEELFDYRKLSKEEWKEFLVNDKILLPESLYQACKKGDVLVLGETKTGVNRNIPEEVKRYISTPGYFDRSLKFVINSEWENCFEIENKEEDDEEYIKNKEQYLSDLAAYEEHPNLYDRKPEFKEIYKYVLHVTEAGKKFVEWYEG